MKAPNVSTWSIPYLSLFTLLTGYSSKLKSRIYQMRTLIRIGTMEILSNFLQAVVLTSFIKSLQKTIETAFFLLEKKKDISLLITQFNIQLILYAILLHSSSILDLGLRFYRNYYLAQHAKKLPEFTQECTNQHTFKSPLAKNAIKNDRDTARLTDTIKSYYMVCQSFIMVPIEILTYLCTLGPTILLTIGLLSAIAGYSQKLISSYVIKTKKAKTISQEKANASKHLNHPDLIHAMLDLEIKDKGFDSLSTYLDVFISNTFQILVLLICSYFIFTGAYNLAMMSVQIAAAPAALRRIIKHLSLIKSHHKFTVSMENRFDLLKLKIFNTPEDPENSPNSPYIANEIEGYKTFQALEELLSYNDNTFKDRLRKIINESKCSLTMPPRLNFAQIAAPLLRELKEKTSEDMDTLTALNLIAKVLKRYKEQLKSIPPHSLKSTIDQFETYINKQDTLKTSLYSKFPSYSLPNFVIFVAIPIIAFSFFFAPSPFFLLYTALPSLSFSQKIGMGLITYISSFILTYNIKPENTDSTFLIRALQFIVILTTIISATQLFSLITYAFLYENAYTLTATLALLYPFLSTFKHYCLPSILFIADCMAIWVAQEAISLIQTPTYIYEAMFKEPSKGHPQKASPWYFFQQQFEPSGENFSMNP